MLGKTPDRAENRPGKDRRLKDRRYPYRHPQLQQCEDDRPRRPGRRGGAG
ncbi:MAG: hypothetical protein MZU79_04375 [Anaerotruncus sp.]|nr:hypothetical protein [Anaerotruncus sp.]